MVHLAGQVAVTTSVANPREDFEINALGTFNVLEAARQADVGIRDGHIVEIGKISDDAAEAAESGGEASA